MESVEFQAYPTHVTMENKTAGEPTLERDPRGTGPVGLISDLLLNITDFSLKSYYILRRHKFFEKILIVSKLISWRTKKFFFLSPKFLKNSDRLKVNQLRHSEFIIKIQRHKFYRECRRFYSL